MSGRVTLRDEDIRAMLLARAESATFPDLLGDIMDQVHAAPTRPRFNLARSFGAPVATALAAGIVIAIVAVFATLRPPDVGPPSTPTPTPSPAASTAAMVAVGLDGTPMGAGRYRTVFFQPPFEFEVPGDHWVAAQDIPRQWFLRSQASAGASEGVDALTIVHLENVYVDPCTKGVDGGTQPWSGDAAAFFEWLVANAPAQLGTPEPTTLFGQPGLALELVQPDLSSCTLGYLPITDVGRPFTTGLPGQRTRYVAVDVDGQTLIVVTWASDPARWDALRSLGDDVLTTVTFTN